MTRALRVALLTNFLPPYRLDFLAELERQVGELTILVSAHTEHNRTWESDHGALTVVPQRTLTVRGRWRHRAGFQERRQIHVPLDTLSRLRRLSPDAVVSGELGARTGLATVYARRSGTPIICWATLSRETEAGLGPIRTRYRRFLARRIDHWFVNGASGRDEVVSYGVDPAAITIVPQSTLRSSASPEPRFARGGSDEPLRLLFVGQLIERKGILQLLAAIERSTDDRDVELTIIGDGPLRSEIERVAGSSRCKVVLLGAVAHDAVLEEYQAHDLFVLPTLADEWAVVVNEAMACGLGVFGSRASQAVSEMVDDSVHGIVFHPTPEGLDAGLARVLRLTPTEVRDLGVAARRRALDFDIDVVAPLMADSIGQAVSSRVQRPARIS